jgi:hypothetical protein
MKLQQINSATKHAMSTSPVLCTRLRCVLIFWLNFLYQDKKWKIGGGGSKYSSPLSLISYMVANKVPNFPFGKPFCANHSRYDTGNCESTRSLYLPKGIFICTKSNNNCGSPIGTSSIEYGLISLQHNP